MDTTTTNTQYTKVTITLPKELVSRLSKITKNKSGFIAQSVENEIARTRKLRAMKKIEKSKPLFEDIEDSVAWVRKLRSEWSTRSKRFGL